MAAARGLVRTATREAQRRLADRGFSDVTPIDSVILVHLLRVDQCRPSELAAGMSVSKQALQAPLKRIQARGYVERAADPNDGRAQLLRLTVSGRAAACTALEVAEAIDRDWEVDAGTLAECKRLLLALARQYR